MSALTLVGALVLMVVIIIGLNKIAQYLLEKPKK